MCFVWAGFKKKKKSSNYDGHDSPVCSSTFHLRVLPFGFGHIHLWYLPCGSYQWLKFATIGSAFQIHTAIRFDPPLPRYLYNLTVFKVDLSRSSPYLNVKLEFKLKTTCVRECRVCSSERTEKGTPHGWFARQNLSFQDSSLDDHSGHHSRILIGHLNLRIRKCFLRNTPPLRSRPTT